MKHFELTNDNLNLAPRPCYKVSIVWILKKIGLIITSHGYTLDKVRTKLYEVTVLAPWVGVSPRQPFITEHANTNPLPSLESQNSLGTKPADWPVAITCQQRYASRVLCVYTMSILFNNFKITKSSTNMDFWYICCPFQYKDPILLWDSYYKATHILGFQLQRQDILTTFIILKRNGPHISSTIFL